MTELRTTRPEPSGDDARPPMAPPEALHTGMRIVRLRHRVRSLRMARGAAMTAAALGAILLAFLSVASPVGASGLLTGAAALAAAGVVVWPPAALLHSYSEQRRIHLTRRLYRLGFRLDDDGHLMRDEPQARPITTLWPAAPLHAAE